MLNWWAILIPEYNEFTAITIGKVDLHLRLALLHKERSVWFEGRGDSLNDINVLASSNEESAKQLAYRTI